MFDLLSGNWSLVGNLSEFSVRQAVILSFLGFMSVEFLLHTFVILHVLICLSCRKSSSLPFGLFIATIFLAVRVAVGILLLTIFHSYFPWILYFAVPKKLIEAVYYGVIAGILLEIVRSILTGLTIICSGNLRRSEELKISNATAGAAVDVKPNVQPMVAILIPVYNEEEEVLIRSVDSVIQSVYPQDKKHLFVSFDDLRRGSLFNRLIKHLCAKSSDFMTEYEQMKNNQLHDIEPISISGTVEGMQVTVSTFVHAGKRLTQSNTYKLIYEKYSTTAADAYVLPMDSDVYLDPDCVQDLIDYSTSRSNILGLTGLITCAQPEGLSVLEQLQNADRIGKETMDRTFEAALGANNCLHGMMTILPLTALIRVAPTYFGHTDVTSMSTIEYHQYQLGEDRYLTLLLIAESTSWGQVGFSCKPKCRSVFPSSFIELLKQRRRWFLASFANDINLLCMPGIWRHYGLLLGFKAYHYLSRGFTFVILGMLVLEIVSEDTFSLRCLLTMCTLALLMLVRMAVAVIACIRLKEYKTACCVPLTIVFFPFFEQIVMIFSLCTWRTRTWGGPRVDKEKQLGKKVQVP